MSKTFPLIFGGIVAYMLLVLYAGSVVYMAKGVVQHGYKEWSLEKDKKTKTTFSSGLVYVVTTIGGLVSALVIAKLANAKPGESPALMLTAEETSEWTAKLASYLAAAYLIVWMSAGLAALLVGVMIFPDSNSTLSDIGTTWLGLAVASGYAYFGLSPAR